MSTGPQILTSLHLPISVQLMVANHCFQISVVVHMMSFKVTDEISRNVPAIQVIIM